MTIYTKNSINFSAIQMTKIYEKSNNKNDIIIGFDAHGDIDYGFNNVTNVPELIVKPQHSVLEDWLVSFHDSENWTNEERIAATEAFKLKLEELRRKVKFDCNDECVDIDEEMSMQTHLINRDNDKNLRFTGELIASAKSSPNNSHPDYSRSNGRWTELRLYKTKSGKFICEEIGRTQWQGESDRSKGAVCETEEAVIDFFGKGWLSKMLYESAGIECIEDID